MGTSHKDGKEDKYIYIYIYIEHKMEMSMFNITYENDKTNRSMD